MVKCISHFLSGLWDLSVCLRKTLWPGSDRVQTIPPFFLCYCCRPLTRLAWFRFDSPRPPRFPKPSREPGKHSGHSGKQVPASPAPLLVSPREFSTSASASRPGPAQARPGSGVGSLSPSQQLPLPLNFPSPPSAPGVVPCRLGPPRWTPGGLAGRPPGRPRVRVMIRGGPGHDRGGGRRLCPLAGPRSGSLPPGDVCADCPVPSSGRFYIVSVLRSSGDIGKGGDC